MILYYDGDEGAARFDAYTTAYASEPGGKHVATLTCGRRDGDGPVRATGRQWTVHYHPAGVPDHEADYGPFPTWAEATERLQAAYARHEASGSPEDGLVFLESKDYPWPGTA